jgi:hypothetical protein
MSVDQKYFNIIKTPNDNNCLFRSMVIFLNNHLLSCRRNKEGRPVIKNLTEYEDNCTRFLRETVVRIISSRKEKYTSNEYYDSTYYTSIEDRIEKMSNEGVFGGKLEMDIISKMYKINISVFIEFDGEYSSIYRSSLDDDTEYHFKKVLDNDYEDYSYSKGDTCFLLLEDDHYQVLEPDFIKINKDFTKKIIDKVIEEDTISLQLEDEMLKESCNQNVTISICERTLTNNTTSNSNLSDSSFLNSSNNSFFNEDSGFEKIEINRKECVSPLTNFKNNKFIDRLREFNSNNKNAILINSLPDKNIFIEIKENYKDICFNDLIDIITSIE